MNTTPENEKRDAAKQRRAKLIGRAFVIGLILLIAVYLVPLFLSVA